MLLGGVHSVAVQRAEAIADGFTLPWYAAPMPMPYLLLQLGVVLVWAADSGLIAPVIPR
jgi:hypothetical protein